MDRIQRLKKRISEEGMLLVMLSGGLDSTVLAMIASEVLGNNALAVTVDSPLVARTEMKRACKMARNIGIKHEVISVDELESREFRLNPPDRCYICRKIRDFSVIKMSHVLGFSLVADGMNASDLLDFRPGLKAADEDGIWHPFIDLGITKDGIRDYARQRGLASWDAPPTVGLCSRIPYGLEITPMKLSLIEKAEEFLLTLGFKEVRVRCLPYYTAMVEVNDPTLVMDLSGIIVTELRNMGFSFVTVDMEGLERGKMNRILDLDDGQV